MKIPLRQLEEALSDPRAYVRSRKDPGRGFSTKSKYVELKEAVFRFHKSEGNLDYARRSLEERFDKKFKDKRDLPKYIEKLETYAAEFSQLNSTVVRVRHTLVVPI